MKPKKQNKITFINDCNCLVDYTLLEKAIIWYQPANTNQIKHIYMHGNYPAVSIYKEKIHIHRLLKCYLEQRKLSSNEYVHHIDGDKLNSNVSNLQIIQGYKHQSLHNKDKVLTTEHRQKISKANHNRLGIKMKKRVKMPDLGKFLQMNWSINKIAKFYKCDWSTVKARVDEIYENPELLEEKECQ